MNKLFVISGFMVSILFFSFSHAPAIGTPTAVCPGLPHGQTGPYQSSKTPTFTWTSVEGATWYQIYLSPADFTGTPILRQWVRNVTSWTLGAENSLEPGIQYSWWVRSYDGSYGSWSNRANFTAGSIKTMAIHPAAFTPHDPATIGKCDGGCLRPTQNYNSAAGIYNVWYAPLALPHGARLILMKFFYFNAGAVTSPSQCWLEQAITYNSFLQIVTLDADTIAGSNDSVMEEINYSNVVDNHSHCYLLYAHLPTVNNLLVMVEVRYWD